MKNYVSLCIWGEGPGRPYDNVYILENITFNNNILHLFFDEEECIIVNPQNITLSEKTLKIEKADKIVWKFYYYGIKKSSETLNIIEFDMINNSEVNISNNGIKKVLSIKKGKIAFDSFGNMSSFSNLNLISNKN